MNRVWPIHLKPQQDELLSSWLVRLSRAYHNTPYSFCRNAFNRIPIWTRDIDLIGHSKVFQLLSKHTACPMREVKKTCLSKYNGIIFEECKNTTHNSWILPIKKYHRIIKGVGLQCCVKCLKEAKHPYFKSRWRLSCINLCVKHRCYLVNHCKLCGASINPHRVPINRELYYCYNCMNELIEFKKDIPAIYEIRIQQLIEELIEQETFDLNPSLTTYSLFIFNTLYCIIRSFREIKSFTGLPMQFSRLEGVAYRRHLYDYTPSIRSKLVSAYFTLLLNWPDRFVAYSSKNRLWRSFWMNAGKNLPFWFVQVVERYLDKKQRFISEEEVISAYHYLRGRQTKPVSTYSLEKLFGCRGVFSKDRKHELLKKLKES